MKFPFNRTLPAWALAVWLMGVMAAGCDIYRKDTMEIIHPPVVLDSIALPQGWQETDPLNHEMEKAASDQTVSPSFWHRP